jgi:ribosomal protein S18 acetylase RimI-like enzyme
MVAIPRPAVRAATVSDAKQVADIHVRSWQAAHAGLLPQEYLDSLRATRPTEWQEILVASDWPKSGVLLVAPEKEVIGYAEFGPTRDDGEDRAQVAEIRDIYLVPEAWGKGIGKRLMSTAIARLGSAGYSQVTLWVLASNTRARGFYTRCGWIEDGARSDVTQGFPIEEVRYRKQIA